MTVSFVVIVSALLAGMAVVVAGFFAYHRQWAAVVAALTIAAFNVLYIALRPHVFWIGGATTFGNVAVAWVYGMYVFRWRKARS